MSALRVTLFLLALIVAIFGWTYDGPLNSVAGVRARSAHEANLIRSRLLQAMSGVDPQGPTQWIRKWTVDADQ